MMNQKTFPQMTKSSIKDHKKIFLMKKGSITNQKILPELKKEPENII